MQITDEPYTQAKVSKVETEGAKEQPCKYFDSFLLPLAPNWVTITMTFMQPFVFREDTLKVSWESLKLRKVSKKLRDSTRSLKLLPARKEEENAWRNFDINVSPSHFNLISAAEVEDKYKTKVEQKLRECYEKNC